MLEACLNTRSLLVAGAFVFMSCSNYNGNVDSGKPAGKSDSQSIYVDTVEPTRPSFTAEQLSLRIKGNLPSPAYKFDRFEVKVKGREIAIRPLATIDTSVMAAQVLVPFEQVCEVENVKPGSYEVKVYGRGGNVVSIENIKVED